MYLLRRSQRPIIMLVKGPLGKELSVHGKYFDRPRTSNTEYRTWVHSIKTLRSVILAIYRADAAQYVGRRPRGTNLLRPFTSTSLQIRTEYDRMAASKTSQSVVGLHTHRPAAFSLISLAKSRFEYTGADEITTKHNTPRRETRIGKGLSHWRS